MSRVKHRFEIEIKSGEVRCIYPSDEPAFFDAIRSRTGLDRTMAEAILLSGKQIEHPDGTFRLNLEEKHEQDPRDRNKS